MVVVANLEDFDEGSQNRGRVGFGVPIVDRSAPTSPPFLSSQEFSLLRVEIFASSVN